jgi:gamma-glutamyl hydrolase
VDWIEASGAVAIPIPYDATPQLLDDLFAQMNGLLLPGGWNGFMPPSVPYILDKIVDSNDRGQYFPVWGTCLGYEFLVKYVGGIDAIQPGFHLYNASIPLESVRFGQLYDDPIIYQTVTEAPVTLNNHQLGVEPDHFLRNEKLTSVWNITSINYDSNGRPFVSTIEPIDPLRFPLYGVQYHPEKNGYEYTTFPGTNIPYESIDHSPEGIAFSIHLSNFFVDLVRYGQSVNSEHEYTKPDVYPPISSYTLSTGVKYEEIYIIPYATHWTTAATTTTTMNTTTSVLLPASTTIVSTGVDATTALTIINNNDSSTTSLDDTIVSSSTSSFGGMEAIEDELKFIHRSSNILATTTTTTTTL